MEKTKQGFRTIEDFRWSFILALLFLRLSGSFWDARYALLPLAAISVHMLGHIDAFVRFRLPWKLNNRGLTAKTENGHNSESFRHLLIYLNGPISNVSFALLMVALNLLISPEHEFLLMLANFSAFIGIINLIPVGRLDLGQLLEQVFRLGRFLRFVVYLEVIFSIGLLGISLYSNSNLTLNISLVLLWLGLQMFQKDKRSEVEGKELGLLSFHQVVFLLILSMVTLGLGLVVVSNTPFLVDVDLLSGISGSLLAEQGVSDLFGIILIGTFVLLISIFLHEIGHLFAALAFKFDVSRMVIGHPGTSTIPNRMLWKFKIGNLPFEIYSRIYFIAADIHTGAFTKSFFKSLVLSMSGPLVNVCLIGVGAIIYVAASPKIGGAIMAINVVMFVVNMLPIPGLDGGWPILNLAIKFRIWKCRRNISLTLEEEDQIRKDVFDSVYERVALKVPWFLTTITFIYLVISLTSVLPWVGFDY